ncbi:UNVERIFIED_ORG: gluconate kinase [Arthrobacter globiformis]|nr:gluconate kinase [Arthrobacter globiformis]
MFIHLSGEAATISGRISGRAHEYMSSSLLASQLAMLEPLGTDEADIPVDIVGRPASLVDGSVRELELA